MKQATINDALNLEPRTEDELHETLSRFESKWQHKSRLAEYDDRF